MAIVVDEIQFFNFMNWLTLDRVVPMVSANVSWIFLVVGFRKARFCEWRPLDA